jgi:putative transposase
MRKTYDAAFKAKVAFEAAKGEKTIAQIASEFSVHPNQIRLWRKHLMEQLPELFSSRRPQQEKAREEPEAEFYQQIGQLKMELEWLKKSHRLFCRDEAGRGGKSVGDDVGGPAMRASGAFAFDVLLSSRGRGRL